MDTGVVLWNGAALDAKLELAKSEPIQPELRIKAAASAKYEVLAGVLASAQRIGLTKLGIVGSEQFAN